MYTRLATSSSLSYLSSPKHLLVVTALLSWKQGKRINDKCISSRLGNHYILLAREKGSKYQNIKQKNDKANYQSLLKAFVDKR